MLHRHSTLYRLRGRRPRRSRGAALIEMLFSMLVLFGLMMGGVEFGWYMYAKHMVQAAARDGARQGIIGTTTHAQAVAAINDTMQSAGFTSGYTITFQEVTAGAGGALAYTTTTDISSVDPGNGLRVIVAAPFSAFRVRPLGVIPADKQVVGITTMVAE